MKKISVRYNNTVRLVIENGVRKKKPSKQKYGRNEI